MFISVTTPAQGAGISIEALSLSSVIMLSSASIVSPTDTKISITSTSSKSPISGNCIFLISDISKCAIFKVCNYRINHQN
jgi:hypothetical protein